MDNNFKYVLFDLDGTLIDTAEGIRNSFIYAFNKMGIEIPSESEIKGFMGPPLEQSFSSLGLSGDDIVKAVSFFRENYKATGIYECKVFEGIEYTLKKIKEAGKIIIVTTSKVQYFAEKVIKDNNISKYFDFICGSDISCGRDSKTKVIEYAFDVAKIKNKCEAIIIGDTKYDIKGAKDTGIKSIGAFYGYGEKSDLEKADFTVDTPYNILDIIL